MMVVVMALWSGCARSVSPDALIAETEGRARGDKSPTNPAAEPKEIIEPGDGLEILVQRGAGEEKYTPPVRANGIITVAFVDIDVKGLTESEAEARITEELTEVIRNPRILVRITQKG